MNLKQQLSPAQEMNFNQEAMSLVTSEINMHANTIANGKSYVTRHEVLFVNADWNLCYSVKRLMTEFGFNWYSAKTALDAVKILSKISTITMIILDETLPTVSTDKFIEFVRHNLKREITFCLIDGEGILTEYKPPVEARQH